eukprot:1674400-Rhodomonas_salina.1
MMHPMCLLVPGYPVPGSVCGSWYEWSANGPRTQRSQHGTAVCIPGYDYEQCPAPGTRVPAVIVIPGWVPGAKPGTR